MLVVPVSLIKYTLRYRPVQQRLANLAAKDNIWNNAIDKDLFFFYTVNVPPCFHSNLVFAN